MFERFIAHRKIYIFFLLLLVFGISTGKFLMSVGTIGISFNWLVEGNYKEKYNRTIIIFLFIKTFTLSVKNQV